MTIVALVVGFHDDGAPAPAALGSQCAGQQTSLDLETAGGQEGAADAGDGDGAEGRGGGRDHGHGQEGGEQHGQQHEVHGYVCGGKKCNGWLMVVAAFVVVVVVVASFFCCCCCCHNFYLGYGCGSWFGQWYVKG